MLEKSEEVRVLLVDDSKTALRLLTYILEQHYKLCVAEDGQEAIAAHGAFHPDVIILDMNLPIKSGLEVMDHIRNVAQDHDVQIVMLTAHDTMGFKATAFHAGANDFLAKPFDREELLARVGAAARQVSLTRQLRQAYDRISQEIDLVAGLQRRLLPSCTPISDKAAVDCFYRPSGRASGDYYDFFTLPDGTLRVVMADVSGHGARAAFLMAVVRTLMRVSQTHYLTLTETFSLVNTHLLSTIWEEPDFVSILGLDIAPGQKSITYINAGHCPALFHQEGQVQELMPNAAVLGFFTQEFVPAVLTLVEPASLFLFTDGWYEWRDKDQGIYGLERFQELARKLFLESRFSLEALGQGLEDDAGIKPVFLDDVTALWVRLGRPRRLVFQGVSSPGNSRKLARQVVAAVGQWVGDADTLHDLDIMVTEACANVSRHAYGEGLGLIEVRLSVTPERSADVQVVDWGKGFGKDINFEKPSPESECGRGMFIIQKLSDICDMESRDGQNILHMVKKIRKNLWKT